jgi:hypothetical protein
MDISNISRIGNFGNAPLSESSSLGLAANFKVVKYSAALWG